MTAPVKLDPETGLPQGVFAVPVGTKPSPCKSCGARCYWITHPKKGSPLLVDCDAEKYREKYNLHPPTPPDGKLPRAIVTGDGTQMWPPSKPQPRAGKGVAHFAVCRDAAKWRGRGRGSGT